MSAPVASSASSSAAEADGRPAKRPAVEAESLGWLTESAVMPRKHRAIEGVGAGSLLELKAQLYRSQEEAKANSTAVDGDAQFRRAKPKPVPARGVYSGKNPGVEAREHKDKLEMKAQKDGSASYAALERKAELYEKLSRGELPDEEENEKYCVDFFQKGLDHERQAPPESKTGSYNQRVDDEDNESSDMLAGTNTVGLGRAGATANKDEHRQFVWEVHEEATEARQKALALKHQRQEQEAARREKLRKAYLKKQLEKALATRQAEAASAEMNKPA